LPAAAHAAHNGLLNIGRTPQSDTQISSSVSHQTTSQLTHTL
jgi:hypothetical protein